jgi:hypothetical protein
MIRSPTFHPPSNQETVATFHAAHTEAFTTWAVVTGVAMADDNGGGRPSRNQFGLLYPIGNNLTMPSRALYEPGTSERRVFIFCCLM